MAVGDRVILDVVTVGLAAPGTANASLVDISGFLSRAELVITNTLVTTPATFGSHGESNDPALAHNWQLILDIYTDGYGGNTIDEIVTNLMRPPTGPSTGTGKAQVLCRPTGEAASATNPAFGGVVAINEWRPLGGGQKATAVMNTVTWPGDGPLVRDPAR